MIKVFFRYVKALYLLLGVMGIFLTHCGGDDGGGNGNTLPDSSAVTAVQAPPAQNQGNIAQSQPTVTQPSQPTVTQPYRSTFTIGGNVSGIPVGYNITIKNNNTNDSLALTQDGSFTFSTMLRSRNRFWVSITSYRYPTSDSPSLLCTVANEAGEIDFSDITNIQITCNTSRVVTARGSIGGTVSGLQQGSPLVIKNNDNTRITITQNGRFIFPIAMNTNNYYISITQQPTNPNQTCTIENGSGIISSSDITNIEITCVTNTYQVGGTVSGFRNDSLIIKNNGGDALTITKEGSFTFPTALADRRNFNISITKQPQNPPQACTVVNNSGSGVIGGHSIATIHIHCNLTSILTATSLTAGSYHTCAIHDGALKCWGSNQKGELGNGSSDSGANSIPVQVTGLTSGVSAIAAGSYHTCAIDNDKNVVKCWGDNYYQYKEDALNGEMINLSKVTSNIPVTIRNLPAFNISTIAAARNNTYVIKEGSLIGWDSYTFNRYELQILRHNTIGYVPYWGVRGLSSGVSAVAAGEAHTCAIHNGALKCWGSNMSGQLGIETQTDSYGNETISTSADAPVQVTGLTSCVSAVAAGEAHTCAIHNNVVKCWGYNVFGQMGDGSTPATRSSLTPAEVSGF